MIRVTFVYDEEICKWEVVVTGTKDATESMQAFNAVVLTCHEFKVRPESVLRKTILKTVEYNSETEEYTITPTI